MASFQKNAGLEYALSEQPAPFKRQTIPLFVLKTWSARIR